MGRIITTLDQILRAKVRLLENPPRMGARVEGGYLHWQVGRYREKLFRVGPGGVGRKQIWVPEFEAEQHNLVLNQAYDSLIPQHGLVPLNRYAAVGTGSTAPAPTQTGLVNEVARTGTVPGGESDQVLYISPGVYDIRRVKEFTEAQVGGRNLTEWGFSPVSSAGNNLMCRELFRDGNGNPVVLTLDADQRLRLIYTLRITLTPVTPQAVTVNIAGVGTRTGQFMLTGHLSTRTDTGGFITIDHGGIAFNSFSEGDRRGDLLALSVFAAGSRLGYTPDLFLSSNAAPLTYLHTTAMLGGNAAPNFKQLSYLPPSGRSRSAYVLVANTEWVFTFRSICLRATTSNSHYYTPTINLVLDFGQEFTKDNLNKLLIGNWVLTWGP